MIRNVLFDFDGTLADTNGLIIASWQHTYRTYLGHEVPEAHITACFGEPLLTTMAREFPMVTPEEAAEVYRVYQLEQAKDLIRAFPGVREMLEALGQAGFAMGIVTSRVRASALQYMEMLGLRPFFREEAIVTCDDTRAHKPDPAPVLLALERMGASAAETVMVGDSLFDMKCANNAGVGAVLVGWRVTDDNTSLIADAKIDGVVETPDKLLPFLQRYGRAE